MKLWKRLVLGSLLVFVLQFNTGCSNNGSRKVGVLEEYPTPPAGAAPLANWNFLVYLVGDNDLEPDAIADFCKMETIGSTDKVNILALFDRTPGYDYSHGNWSNTRLYRISHDPNSAPGSAAKFRSWYIRDYGEANMADPDTLRDFIEYCNQWFPARHTVLVLWNHGGGVYGDFDSEELTAKGIGWDDSTGTIATECLSTADVKNALALARSATGQKIDIINMKACVMQLLEVAYEWRAEADYLVGSEEAIPTGTADFDIFLGWLVANPDSFPNELAIKLVDEFYNNYARYNTTFSALELNQADNFGSAFKAFAAALNQTAVLPAVRNAVSATTRFFFPEIIDLYDFANNLATVPDSIIGYAAGALKTALEAGDGHFIIRQRANGVYTSTTHGLAITLPYNTFIWSKYAGPGGYPTLALAQDTEWDDFIIKLINGK